MELRVRTSLGSDIRELVACRGLNEAWNASVDVVAHEAPAKVHMLRTVLEVPVLKHCDVASQESTVMSSASLVERARIGARADFHEKGCTVAAQNIAQRAAARRLVVGPAGVGEAEDLTTLKWSFVRASCELEMLDTFEVEEDLLAVAVVLTSSSGHVPSQCTKSVHDLGHRADVEQLADQFNSHR
jgi:hypothetical protein